MDAGTNSNSGNDRDPTEWNSDLPVDRDEGTGRNAGNAIQFRWWNLLLMLPLIMLLTPIFNKDEPRLFGLPAFYWYQFAFVFVGVSAVAIVYVATKDPKKVVPPTGRDTRDEVSE